MRVVFAVFVVAALFFALAPARAQTLVLVCKWQDFENTYYVDMAARTVTTAAHSRPGSGQQQTFPAEITDRLIRYEVAHTQIVTIDRYSGTLSFNDPTNITYQCRTAKRAIE